MEPNQRQIMKVIVGALCAVVIVLALLYVRQRLFTRTEPIVLSA